MIIMKTTKVPNIWEENNSDKTAGFKSQFDPININDLILPQFGIGYYGTSNQNISILKVKNISKVNNNTKGDILIEFDFINKIKIESKIFNSKLPLNYQGSYLNHMDNKEFIKLFPDIDIRENDSEKQIENNINKNISNSLNEILFGTPGTGKTYKTKNKSISIIKNINMENKELSIEEKLDLDNEYATLYNEGRIKFITFHPSYSYEDFIEGIRPVIDKNIDIVKFELKNGIFKELCLTALKEYDENNKLINWENYENDIKTKIDKNAKSNRNDKSIKKYVLIIDEINRGDISKIFGELITLIEEDKRIGGDNQITVQLPYSEDNFGIPPNLYIVGTMNTADRSLALLDIALRRRFDFIEMVPDFQQLKKDPIAFGISIEMNLLEPSITALEKINKYLGENPDIGKDKKIGHAYFCNIDNESKINNIWKNKILPLMEEYYFFDKEALEKISGGNYSLSSGWKFNQIEQIINHFSNINTIVE